MSPQVRRTIGTAIAVNPKQLQVCAAATHWSGLADTGVDRTKAQIPLEAAALACQRWQGVVELPLKLESVASEEALSTGQSAKRRRQRGQNLTDQLKHISRSEARGGLHNNLSQAKQERSIHVRTPKHLFSAAIICPNTPQSCTLADTGQAPKARKHNFKQELAQLRDSVHHVQGDLAEYKDPQLPLPGKLHMCLQVPGCKGQDEVASLVCAGHGKLNPKPMRSLFTCQDHYRRAYAQHN